MSSGATWTAERDEVLRTVWTEGKSVAQCAEIVGGLDHLANGGKNAVIGRARRLGLSKPRIVMSPEERAARKVAQSKKDHEIRKGRRRARTGVKRKSQMERASIVAEAPVEPQWVFETPFNDLRDFSRQQPNQCRYPDPKDNAGPNYMCCGVETGAGKSYCGHCEEICRGETRKIVVLTEAQRESRHLQGLRAGYATLRSRGRVLGRAVATATSPVLDNEARV